MLLIDQYILRFEISVHVPFFVEVAQSTENLLKDIL